MAYVTQSRGKVLARTACTDSECCNNPSGWVNIGTDESLAKAEDDLARMMRQPHRKGRASDYRIIEVT
jgi:hypothetical protein